MESYFSIPDGCSKHPKCSTCPFPECRASIKDLKKQSSIDDRHNEIFRLHNIGLTVPEIMHRTGFKDKGTVYRILREYGLT